MAGVGTTHNVKIGSDYFLVRPGSYRKRAAPTFGARFATGDPDYNTLSFWQHWVQRCWVGGFGAAEWQDDAMFEKSSGVDASYHEVLLLSRDLSNSGLTNPKFSVESGAAYAREFFVWKGEDDSGAEGLYCLTYGNLAANSWLHRLSGTTWVLVHTFTTLPVRSQARWRQKIYFGTPGGTLAIMGGQPGAETWSTVAKPGGVTDTPYTMAAFRDRLYVGFGSKLWRMKPDGTWDGSTTFFDAAGCNYFVRMENHLGFLYIASQNGHILRTDGNNTFDLWSMETSTVIEGLRSFDGRLFVSCIDPVEGSGASEAVMFQFSGAAVTELKRFGLAGKNLSLGRMRVVGGRLFFGAGMLLGGASSGFGIGMYDPKEDAYHVFSTNRDAVTYAPGTNGGDVVVDDVILYSGYLWVSVRKHGLFRTAYTQNDVAALLATYDTTAAGVGVAAGNGGTLTSSDFDAGTPGLRKLWNQVVLQVDLPNAACSVFLEYSLDGGATWVSQGSATKTGAATRYTVAFQLGAAATGGVYGARFKYRLTLRTTDSTYSPAVRGIAVRYLPVPDPNWTWDMVLVLSDRQTLLDGTTEAPNNATKIANLEAAFRGQSLVAFTDVDGTQWSSGGYAGALIQSLDVDIPVLGPSSDGALERNVRIVLTEAVEAYEL